MRFDRRRGSTRQALSLPKVRAALDTTAHRRAPAVAAATAVSERGGYFSGERTEPGETRRSVHVESGHRANDGRPASRIVVNRAVAPLNFKYYRDYILRAVSGGA